MAKYLFGAMLLCVVLLPRSHAYSFAANELDAPEPMFREPLTLASVRATAQLPEAAFAGRPSFRVANFIMESSSNGRVYDQIRIRVIRSGNGLSLINKTSLHQDVCGAVTTADVVSFAGLVDLMSAETTEAPQCGREKPYRDRTWRELATITDFAGRLFPARAGYTLSFSGQHLFRQSQVIQLPPIGPLQVPLPLVDQDGRILAHQKQSARFAYEVVRHLPSHPDIGGKSVGDVYVIKSTVAGKFGTMGTMVSDIHFSARLNWPLVIETGQVRTRMIDWLE